MFVWKFFRETKVVRIKVGALKECAGCLTFPRRKMDWDMNFEKRNHGQCLPWKFYLWPTDLHRTCARPHSIPADFRYLWNSNRAIRWSSLYIRRCVSHKFLEISKSRFTRRDRVQRKFSIFTEVEVEALFAVLTTVVASALSSVSNPFDGDDDDEDIEESRVESGQWRDVHAPIAW